MTTARKTVSFLLLLISVGLSFKHGWDSFHMDTNPEALKMLQQLGISESAIPVVGGLSLLTGLLLIFPQTFLAGNILSILTITLVMIRAIQFHYPAIALLEIPFLLLPLLLILLKHSLRQTPARA